MKEIKRLEEGNSFYAIYEINGYKVTYSKEEWGISICVNPIDSRSYLPEIYYEGRMFGANVNRFKIQTTSYGALESSEIDKVIAGYKTAQETVAELEKFFELHEG